MIHLNPHKCIFSVLSNILLGFIMSSKRTMVDLLMVEVIFQFPPPHTLH
jgi:hypothetical protein